MSTLCWHERSINESIFTMVSPMKRVFLSLLVLASSPLFAHHNWRATYDQAQRTSIQGVIEDVRWRNPHLGFTLLISSDAGQVAWELETSSPQRAQRRGISSADIPLGTEVSVEGFPARDGSTRFQVLTMTMPDGQVIEFQRERGGRGERGEGRRGQGDRQRRPLSE